MTDTPTTHEISNAELAKVFHDAYERLAPSFGYETRAETRTFDAASPNGRLMIATCQEVVGKLLADAEKMREALIEIPHRGELTYRRMEAKAEHSTEKLVWRNCAAVCKVVASKMREELSKVSEILTMYEGKSPNEKAANAVAVANDVVKDARLLYDMEEYPGKAELVKEYRSLRHAAIAFDAVLSTDCDCEEREALRGLLGISSHPADRLDDSVAKKIREDLKYAISREWLGVHADCVPKSVLQQTLGAAEDTAEGTAAAPAPAPAPAEKASPGSHPDAIQTK